VRTIVRIVLSVNSIVLVSVEGKQGKSRMSVYAVVLTLNTFGLRLRTSFTTMMNIIWYRFLRMSRLT